MKEGGTKHWMKSWLKVLYAMQRSLYFVHKSIDYILLYWLQFDLESRTTMIDMV